MTTPAIKTILVPIDFSKLSNRAIETAKEIAQLFDATVHLAHVHEFYYPPGFIAPVPISVIACRDDAAIQRNRKLKALGKKNGVGAVNCHFLDGAPPFNEICKLAGRISADLIVMPTHGYTGMTRIFPGSTAERIVQHSPCPVLVIRAAKKGDRSSREMKTKGINSILVPVDFSPSSFRAFEYALKFAERVAARVIALHIVQLGEPFTADGYAMYDLSRLIEAARKSAEARMQQFLRLAKIRRVNVNSGIHVGLPASGICDFAKELEVDLIITATHGLTGLKHLLMGSVAERVVRHADRPVLVVPSHPELRVHSSTQERHSSTEKADRRPETLHAARGS